MDAERCPECGSDDIETRIGDFDGNYARENCGCNHCKASWYNHYKLADQEVIRDKNGRDVT